MIPLRDINPRSTTPIFTWSLILANVLVFLYQAALEPRAALMLVFTYGMIPARLELAFTTHEVTLGQAFLPFLSSIFLHGGWWHLLGNMWFLWVFGDNIEDRLGHLRFLLFYLLTGVGAGLCHVAFNLDSTLPAVGASGAISGILGAYFVLFPRSRVLTLIPLVVTFIIVELPAAIILGYWLLIQALSGLHALGTRQPGGVAWWAHIGGFVLGIVLAKIARPRRVALRYE
jgi:hypothetical protein